MATIEIFGDREDVGRLVRCCVCKVTVETVMQIYSPDEGRRRFICGMCHDRGWSFDMDGTPVQELGS
jgi:hypothetical protein